MSINEIDEKLLGWSQQIIRYEERKKTKIPPEDKKYKGTANHLPKKQERKSTCENFVAYEVIRLACSQIQLIMEKNPAAIMKFIMALRPLCCFVYFIQISIFFFRRRRLLLVHSSRIIIVANDMIIKPLPTKNYYIRLKVS
jgi:hypothetical protein